MFVLDDNIIAKKANKAFWENSNIKANYNNMSITKNYIPSKPKNTKPYTLNNRCNIRKKKGNNNRKDKSDKSDKSNNNDYYINDIINIKNLNINCYNFNDLNYNEEIKKTKENPRNSRRIYHRGKNRNREGEKRTPKNCSRI